MGLISVNKLLIPLEYCDSQSNKRYLFHNPNFKIIVIKRIFKALSTRNLSLISILINKTNNKY